MKTSGIVEFEKDGKIYKGEFNLTKGILTVTALKGSKQTHSSSKTPEVLAKAILGELVNEGKAAEFI
jgi:hypothetical protein